MISRGGASLSCFSIRAPRARRVLTWEVRVMILSPSALSDLTRSMMLVFMTRRFMVPVLLPTMVGSSSIHRFSIPELFWAMVWLTEPFVTTLGMVKMEALNAAKMSKTTRMGCGETRLVEGRKARILSVAWGGAAAAILH